METEIQRHDRIKASKWSAGAAAGCVVLMFVFIAGQQWPWALGFLGAAILFGFASDRCARP